MARIARIVIPGKAHLVCQSSAQAVFNTIKRRRAYLAILAESAEVYRVKILGWALLRKRAFLVVVPATPDGLGSFMRVVHARYARRLHADGFEGEVTPRRFASCPLDNPTALEALKLIEWMPVRDKLAKKPAEYAFSSAAVRARKSTEGADLLKTVAAITGKVPSWAKFLAKPLDDERADYLLMRVRTGKPAGGKAFIRRIEKAVGMNLSRGRGRPKGS